MPSLNFIKERLQQREIELTRLSKKGKIEAFFTHDTTLLLASRMKADLTMIRTALRHCYRALGMQAHNNYWMKHVGWSPTHYHKKRRSTYLRIGEGSVQNSSGVPLVEGDEVTVYQDDRGRLWVRRATEFDDGRFGEVEKGRASNVENSSPA